MITTPIKYSDRISLNNILNSIRKFSNVKNSSNVFTIRHISGFSPQSCLTKTNLQNNNNKKINQIRFSTFLIRSKISSSKIVLNSIRKYSSFNNDQDRFSAIAQKELIANRESRNPQAQADFYRELLFSNYPQIVVSRYESPGIASNAECHALYTRALQLLRSNPSSSTQASHSMNMNPNMASSQSSSTPVQNDYLTSNIGNSRNPVNVIIHESRASVIFRFVKFLAFVLCMGYLSIILLAYVGETSGILKGPPEANEDPNVQNQTKVKFSDIQGCDEARAELQEIVDFLRDPAQFTGLGGKLPKGVLLTGPPGTGKTLLARAVAGEADVPFFFMSGSEFDEMYVGVGAKRVRELFAAARARAPAIVFIDELDAVGGKRNSRDQAYVKQTLNQLLVDLDGFSQTSGVIFMAATNFPELLDKALLRPGRFDKVVNVELPDVRGRAAILSHYIKKIEASPTVDTLTLARGTTGFSGADIANLVNQAAIHASQLRATAVDMSHFEWAKDKILMGAERKSMVLTEESRRKTAFHEAGHAIAALYTPGASPLYKATILPRGRALGITFQLPEMDKHDQSKKELFARLDVCMGGKMAEEAIDGEENVTSGCSSDLAQATNVARAMVTSFGMSDKIGPVQLSEDYGEWSEHTKMVAEEEIRKFLTQSEERTRILLKEKRVALDRLANALLEYETLDREEIDKVVKGEKLNRPKLVSNTIVKAPTKDPIPSSPRPGVIPVPASDQM